MMVVSSDTSPCLPFRPRRTHKKSRRGCIGCKQRRKKCDERTPSCTACAKRKLPCQYQRLFISSEGRAGVVEQLPQVDSPRDPKPSTSTSTSTSEPTKSYPTPLSLRLSSPSSIRSLESPSPPSSTLGDNGATATQPRDSQPLFALSPTDLDLLQHYLSHTARTTAFDAEDYYTLQIGIPNLAVGSMPLMSSILALAACCKSSDILNLPGVLLPHNRDLVLELLTLADQHHRDSLRQIQADLRRRSADDYDHALANAALMVLYGSASQCIRIRLMEQMTSMGDDVPSDLMPTQSQWISLIRAIQAAYSGLLHDRLETSIHDHGHGREDILSSTASPVAAVEGGAASPFACGEGVILPEDGPTQTTKDLFFPIVMASWGQALERLLSNPYMVAVAQTSTACGTGTATDQTALAGFLCFQDHPGYSTVHMSDLQACFTSLKILEDVFAEVFNTPPHGTPRSSNTDSASSTSPDASAPEQNQPLGRLSQVRPWLRKYLARVTAATSSRPLRRTVMAFLHRVPSQFLALVQTNLDLVDGTQGPYPSGAAGDERNSAFSTRWDQASSPDCYCHYPQAGQSAAHQLAMDIFAHWLVLVMLLDGVWWIGGIGAWELGRVISAMRRQGWPRDHFPHSSDQSTTFSRGNSPGALNWSDGTLSGDRWWPESMYKIAVELQKQTSEGR